MYYEFKKKGMKFKMNDSLYEDYMRSVLGYQPMNNYQDTYNYNNYDNYSSYDALPVMAHMQNQGMQMMNSMMPMQNQNMQSMSARPMTAMSNIQIKELEKCYPEIYQIVYPMVQKACAENRGEITRELVDRLTDEIYSAVEDRELVQDRGEAEATKIDAKSTTTNTGKIEKNKEDRYCQNCDSRQRNTGLNDIIRILLLRELLGRPGFPGFRPPRPPPPPPPRPPRPPMRPPMGPGPGRPPRPRGGEMDIYESPKYFSSLEDGELAY